jgi:hypothetical protein
MKISGWCDNTGTQINVVGSGTLSSVSMKVTLANNRKGTHSVMADTVTDLQILASEGQAIAQKGGLDGVGGNPHVVGQVTDDAGNVVVDENGERMEYYLGRCITGASGKGGGILSANIAKRFNLDGGITSYVGAVECSKKSSNLSVKAAASNEGANLKVILANQVNKELVEGNPGIHMQEIAAEWTTTLIQGKNGGRAGWWDKEAGVHGPGGNPRVYNGAGLDYDVTAWDAKTEATWGTYLDRCNKLY